MNENNENRKPAGFFSRLRNGWLGRRIIAAELVILLLLAVFVVPRGADYIAAVRAGEDAVTVVLEPDFATIEIEPNAVPLAELPEEERVIPAVSDGGGSVTVTFMDDVLYSLARRQLTMFYQNPADSTHSVVVQVVLQNGGNEYLLAQSGILPPGYEITNLSAADGAPALTNGGYNGLLKLLFYDVESGERAIVDTQVPITVTVE